MALKSESNQSESNQCDQLQQLTKQETIRLRQQFIGPSVTLFFRQSPLKIVKGRGQFLLDESGTPYLDCINNVAHVGHCHPHVAQAGARQMALLSTNSRFLHDTLVLYARRLTSTLPSQLSICYFVNSGSEANDLALRLARAHTKHKDVISLDGAYHGHLTSLVDISSYKFKRIHGYRQKKWVHVAPLPCAYRGKFTADQYGSDKVGHLYAEDVREMIDKAHASGRQIAAFISESMVSCGGQTPLPANYLREVYQHVRKAGGVCIADEVQVGFGRVGRHFWAFQLAGSDVCPDILTIGKPMGNGHPVACVVTTPEIAQSFEQIGTEYFNTYGGNPVSVAIANAVLDVIDQEQLQKHAQELGDLLLKELRHLQSKFECVGDVRGEGLFIGIEIVESKATKRPNSKLAEQIVAHFKQNNVLMSTEGFDGNVLKFKPPMCFNAENGRRWLQVLQEALDKLTSCSKVNATSCEYRNPTSSIDSSPIDSGRSSYAGSAVNGSISSTSGLSDDSLTSIESNEDQS